MRLPKEASTFTKIDDDTYNKGGVLLLQKSAKANEVSVSTNRIYNKA